MKSTNLLREINQIRKLMGLKESYQLITESAKTNNMKVARRYLQDKFGYDNDQIMRIFGAIQTDIPNVRLNNLKFLAGVTRMYMEKQLQDGKSIQNLNKTLGFINNDKNIASKFDRNLNNLSAEDLAIQFSNNMKSAFDAEKERMSNINFGVQNKNYTIVPIPDFETASKYGEYTSWCITHYPNMYDSYTNDGLGIFYFCLKKALKMCQRKKEKIVLWMSTDYQ